LLSLGWVSGEILLRDGNKLSLEELSTMYDGGHDVNDGYIDDIKEEENGSRIQSVQLVVQHHSPLLT
jgi:hypothetical protein